MDTGTCAVCLLELWRMATAQPSRQPTQCGHIPRHPEMSDNEHIATDEHKLHDGYHGWMKTIPKTGQDFTPVRIAANGDAPAAAPADVGSVWNKAGTWEERDKSEWARDRLKHHILTAFAFADETRSVEIKASAIVRCDGDAKIVFCRGKKRCGFEMSLKFEWESKRTQEDSEGFDEATGYVELVDFDDTNGDAFDVIVTADGNSLHAAEAKAAVQAWEPQLRQLLSTWKDELLQQ